MDNITITNKLPDDCDLVIALRCLMEMDPEEVHRYMEWIQSRPSVKWFYVINRYLKYHVFKHYPFDRRWIPLVTQPELVFRACHEFMLERMEEETDILRDVMSTFPPFLWKGRMIDYRCEQVVIPLGGEEQNGI